MADEEVQAVNEAVVEVLKIPDRLERANALSKLLEDWPNLHSKLRAARQEIVIEMRTEKLTYRQIGEALGIHHTRVSQIEKGQRGEKNRPKKKADPGVSPE